MTARTLPRGDGVPCALAVGTDLAGVDLTGTPADLRTLAAAVAATAPGDVVDVRCDGVPSPVWPHRVGALRLVAGGAALRVEVDDHRATLTFPAGSPVLVSALDAAAEGPGGHVHLDDGTDGVASGSVPLVVACVDAPGSPRARQDALVHVLLAGDHARHPDAATELAALVAHDPQRRLLAVTCATRALRLDDEPACHDALGDLLVGLVTGAPAWGTADALQDLLVQRAGETSPSRARAVDRVLDAWTDV